MLKQLPRDQMTSEVHIPLQQFLCEATGGKAGDEPKLEQVVKPWIDVEKLELNTSNVHATLTLLGPIGNAATLTLRFDWVGLLHCCTFLLEKQE